MNPHFWPVCNIVVLYVGAAAGLALSEGLYFGLAYTAHCVRPATTLELHLNVTRCAPGLTSCDRRVCFQDHVTGYALDGGGSFTILDPSVFSSSADALAGCARFAVGQMIVIYTDGDRERLLWSPDDGGCEIGVKVVLFFIGVTGVAVAGILLGLLGASAIVQCLRCCCQVEEDPLRRMAREPTPPPQQPQCELAQITVVAPPPSKV